MAVVITAGWNYMQVGNDVQLSDLALENIEALADEEESVAGETCYKSITTQPGSKILYCQTCTYISGTNVWYSGTGTC